MKPAKRTAHGARRARRTARSLAFTRLELGSCVTFSTRMGIGVQKMVAQCVGLFLSTAMTDDHDPPEDRALRTSSFERRTCWESWGLGCWNVNCFFLVWGRGGVCSMQSAWGITSAEVGIKCRLQFLAIRYDSWLHSHLTLYVYSSVASWAQEVFLSSMGVAQISC